MARPHTARVHESAQACRRLGVSASTLRRQVATYEAVFEPLTRDDGGSRYTDAVLTQLERAQALREGGATAGPRTGKARPVGPSSPARNAASLKAALRMLAQGDERLGAQALARPSERDEVSAELLLELRTLTQALSDLNGHMRLQNQRLEALERAPKWWQLRFWKALLKAQRGA